MWICPNCKRKFKIKNQSHSCVLIPIENHFINVDDHVKKCFLELKKTIDTWHFVNEVSTPSAILYSIRSNFLALKPKKKWVDIEFVLSEEIDEFPIHKVVQASKAMFAHFIRIEAVKEVDSQLINWLNMAYEHNIGRLI
ncbi:MAG: hypothetical protein JEZ09_14415 [Salinivirgaceae bacterium]|nr:hypothetical protein [Salinivirgaceae bacterium]